MYEEILKQIDEENERHTKIIGELNEKLEEIREKAPNNNVYFVDESYPEESDVINQEEKQDTGDVYFVPEEKELEVQEIEPIPEEKNEEQLVYMPDTPKKKKQSPFKRFINFLFGIKKEEPAKETTLEEIFDNDQDEIVYMPKDEEVETLDVEPKYTMLEPEPTLEQRYEGIITYAKSLKKEKEGHKKLQEKYLEALKTKDPDEISKAQGMLFNSERIIKKAEIFLRGKVKEIRLSDADYEEKTKLINYICGIAKIKAREKNAHMRRDYSNDAVEDLNERKEKVAKAKHFKEKKEEILKRINEEIENSSEPEVKEGSKKI